MKECRKSAAAPPASRTSASPSWLRRGGGRGGPDPPRGQDGLSAEPAYAALRAAAAQTCGRAAARSSAARERSSTAQKRTSSAGEGGEGGGALEERRGAPGEPKPRALITLAGGGEGGWGGGACVRSPWMKTSAESITLPPPPFRFSSRSLETCRRVGEDLRGASLRSRTRVQVKPGRSTRGGGGWGGVSGPFDVLGCHHDAMKMRNEGLSDLRCDEKRLRLCGLRRSRGRTRSSGRSPAAARDAPAQRGERARRIRRARVPPGPARNT